MLTFDQYNRNNQEVLTILNKIRTKKLTLGSKITDKLLAYLINQPLEELHIVMNRKITDRGMEFVSRLKNLRTLGIEATSLDESCLRYFGPITKLFAPKIITGEGLLNLPNLETLHVRRYNTRKGALKYVGMLKSLKHLDLSQSNIEDEDLLHLSELKNLETLNVSYCRRLTARGLNFLKDLKMICIIRHVPLIKKDLEVSYIA